MASIYDEQFEHLLRRAGFGARPDEIARFGRLGLNGAIDTLVNFEATPDDIDSKISQPGYGQVVLSRDFPRAPTITDFQQLWLFRMLHTGRPLQEKMTLFWHNHFATSYAKVAGATDAIYGARYMAGQVEMLRNRALGNYEELLVEIAKDTAMLIWLDGRLNTRQMPQENFGREIMELFSMGVGHYTEADVHAAGASLDALTLGGSSVTNSLHTPRRRKTAAKEKDQ